MSETDINAENTTVTDDLLDELDKLESSTETMEVEVGRVTEQQDTLAKTDTPNAIEAASLSLESAKTAQQAAEQAQSATEAAVQLSQEQKRQAMDLADSNVAWRQSVRNINKELDSSKNTTTIMLVIAVILSLMSTGIMGFLFYSMNKKNENLKGEVVDIISTQMTLMNKQMTLKTDQMASLIESLAAGAQHRAPQPHQQPVAVAPAVEPPASQPVEAKPATEQKATSTKLAETKPMDMNVTANIDPALKKEIARLTSAQQTQMAKLDAMMAELQKQQKMEAAKPTASNAPATIKTAPIEVTSMGLTESQVKKLNGILWRVSSQAKVLKKIQKTLDELKKSPISHASTSKGKVSVKDPLTSIQETLKSLSAQMKEMQDEQNVLKKQLEEVKENTRKSNAPPGSYEYKAPSAAPVQPVEPKPYSFRAN